MEAVVFDVDGTLSFNGQVIEAPIVAAIRRLQARGKRVIFASARPIRDLLPIIPAFTDQLLIGANGALVANQGQVQIMAPLSSSHLKQLTAMIDRYQLDYVVDSEWDYAARVTTDNLILRQLDPAHLAQKQELSMITSAIKIILLNIPLTHLADLTTSLQDQSGLTVIAHTGEANLDITAAGINKATTLARLGIRKYAAFGNDQNDLAMLAQAQLSIWVTSKPALVDLGRTMMIQCAPTAAAVVEQIDAIR